MPIRNLEIYTPKNGPSLKKQFPMSVLKKDRVCVDGFWFLRKYIDISGSCAIVSSTLKDGYLRQITKLISESHKYNFEILWVWDGLDFKKPRASFLERKDAFEIGLEYYKRKDILGANKAWRNEIDYDMIVDVVNDLLQNFDVSVVTAPYSATAQCAYYIKNRVCNKMFGKSDALLFNLDEVIVDFHFDDSAQENSFVNILKKEIILNAFNLNLEDFDLFCFASGCEFCPTIPEYADNFILENIVTIIKTKDIFEHLEGNDEYIDMLNNAFVLVYNHPIMSLEGVVRPFYDSDVCSNLNDFFGNELPSILYEKMFLNIISPSFLNGFVFGEVEEKDMDMIVFVEKANGIINTKCPLPVVSKEGKMSASSNFKENDLGASKDCFYRVVAPDVKFIEGLNRILQIYIMTALQTGILTSSYVDKILCFYIDEKSNARQVSVDSFTSDTIEFCYKTNKLQKYIKYVKEALEVVFGIDLNIDLGHSTVLNYKNDLIGEDGFYRPEIRAYLEKIYDFLELNFDHHESIAEVCSEIKRVL